MFTFIKTNIYTILVLLVIIASVILIIRGMIRDKKKGIGACGCNCNECRSACPHSNDKKE